MLVEELLKFWHAIICFVSFCLFAFPTEIVSMWLTTVCTYTRMWRTKTTQTFSSQWNRVYSKICTDYHKNLLLCCTWFNWNATKNICLHFCYWTLGEKNSVEYCKWTLIKSLIRHRKLNTFVFFLFVSSDFVSFVGKMSEKMAKEKGNEHIAMRKFDYFRRFLAQVGFF